VERMAVEQLVAWKESPYRKPLMLKGVRQVGKTWLLKEFGRRCYDNIAYFNIPLFMVDQTARIMGLALKKI